MKNKNNRLLILNKLGLGAVIIFILVIGFIRFDNEEHRSYLQTLLDTPQEHDREEVQIGGYIIKNEEQFITIRDPSINHPIKIFKDERFNSINIPYDSITVYGIFLSDINMFLPIKVRIHKFEIFKYILSLIGLLMFLYYFSKEWSITSKGLKDRGVQNTRLD